MGIIELSAELKDLDIKDRMVSPEECLMFAQLAYIPFEEGLKGKRSGRMKDVLESILSSPEPSISLGITKFFDIRLMNNMKNSVRYGDIEVCDFKKVEDDKKQCQFAAVTFCLDDGTKIISYRGTLSETFAWRESLNLAALEKIPSHSLGLKYLEDMAARTRGSIILTGHSKGGNIAMYSLIRAPQEIQDRIRNVYNFDGPGFNTYSHLLDEFRENSHKIRTFIPQSSIVGTLLNHEEEVTVIKSRAVRIMQHDPYSIVIDQGRFVELPELSEAGKIMDITMKKLVDTLTQEETQHFIDTLFTLLDTTEDVGGPFGKVSTFLSSLKSLDESDRRNFDYVIGIYRESLKEAEKETKGEKKTPEIISNFNSAVEGIVSAVLPEKKKDKGTDIDSGIGKEESEPEVDRTEDNPSEI